MANSLPVSAKEMDPKTWFIFVLMWTLYHAIIFGQHYIPIQGPNRTLFFILFFPVYTALLIGTFARVGGEFALKNIGFRFSLGQPIYYWLRFFALFLLGLVILLNVLRLLRLEITWISGENLLPFAIYNYLVAPIPEEILYRCVLCTLVAKRFGWKIAIASSTFLFGLIHLAADEENWGALVSGFFFSWLFYKSRTIILPLSAHVGLSAFMLTMAAHPKLWKTISGFVIVT